MVYLLQKHIKKHHFLTFIPGMTFYVRTCFSLKKDAIFIKISR